MLSVSTQIARDDSLVDFARMLKSVSFADEIFVFNMERNDMRALELFQQFSARVINVKTPKIVEEIRARQVREAGGDWVLILDFDEVIPGELRGEIESIIENKASCSAYTIPRDNYSLDYPMTHGGWERDYVIRLLRKADFIDWPKNIHSTPRFKGSMVKTLHSMEHHKDASLSQMVEKTNRYSDIEADLFFQGGLPPVDSFTLVRKPVMEFIRRYILKKGFLDGCIGLIQALYQGYSVFITYAKLAELQTNYKSSKR
ncbi:MAG: hypothetical protein ABII21_04230 [bacterium]